MEFFVIIGDEQLGPFTLDELATIGITPDTEVWTQGMDDWQAAGDVPALTTLLQRLDYKRHSDAATPPAPRRRMAHSTVGQEHSYIPPERTYSQPMKQSKPRRYGCLVWCAVLAIVALVVLVATVPSRSDHLSAINDATHEWMDATIQDKGLGNSVLGEMAKWIGATGADMVIVQLFDYDNYLVCSVGSLNYGGKSHRVSFGILGRVFTFDKHDINRAIKSAIGIDGSEQPIEPAAQPTPPSQETTPEPHNEAQPHDEAQSQSEESSNPAQDLLDTIASRAKREAVKAAKEWAKKKIDEM